MWICKRMSSTWRCHKIVIFVILFRLSDREKKAFSHRIFQFPLSAHPWAKWDFKRRRMHSERNKKINLQNYYLPFIDSSERAPDSFAMLVFAANKNLLHKVFACALSSHSRFVPVVFFGACCSSKLSNFSSAMKFLNSNCFSTNFSRVDTCSNFTSELEEWILIFFLPNRNLYLVETSFYHAPALHA